MIHPSLREFFEQLTRLPAVQAALVELRASAAANLRITGLSPTAQAIFAVVLQRLTDRPVLLITETNPVAEALTETAAAVYGLTVERPHRAAPLMLPTHDVSPFDGLSPHAEISERRAVALWRMASSGASVVVAPVGAALLKTAPADFFRHLVWTVEVADEFYLEDLEQGLVSVGYARSEPVEMVGQYSVRGGILDAFSPEADAPVRIEMVGDRVESLREFDPETQKSIRRVDRALLLPLSDYPTGSAPSDGPAPGWEFHPEIAAVRQSCIFDLVDQPIVLWSEPDAIQARAVKLQERWEAAREPEGADPRDFYFDLEQLRERAQALDSATLDRLGLAHPDAALEIRSQPTPRFQGNVQQAVGELQAQVESGARVLVAARSLGDLERLADVFAAYNVSFQLSLGDKHLEASPYLEEKSYTSGPLASTILAQALIRDGVAFPDARTVLYGCDDFFAGSELVAKPARSRSAASTFLSGLEDLKPGDLVVHIEHGVGRYLGMTKVEQGSRQEDLMMIEYAERAKLYTPLSRLDLVQKFHGAGGKAPPLDRMGGQTWARTKSRIKARLVDMADELLKLYAERELAAGFAFSPDGEWQREFEDSFEHIPTPDQGNAVAEVKRDMESPRAMDRLICGDVGFGKTEVAMRAAFKALGDGKQVAVLAPTTVLSFQHHETFRRRFRSFPIQIEMLNRFRPPKQQKEVVERLALGEVDIVIGTHRILSKDVEFADLGLLIVDEEQRFGVRHKERLKQIAKGVDVLTLSATPIPRTLHMSLVGLRDISTIQSPPKDRLAIHTVVAPFTDRLVRTAIEQEIGRGGQLYFIHNRVESIWSIAAYLQKLAPQLKIGVGHGQMPERELEMVMSKFMNHEYDLLLATTIVENGLDIPLANTILVDNADNFGLSELYQLRGRVGRSNRRAYAYLLLPQDRELTDIARKRLAALKEFSELGSGFKIAALDLELRGAGNLLGAEQSGHIGAVGFETYCRLLEETVQELRGEKVEEAVRSQLRLQIDIHIPTDYVADETQRLRAYKQLAEIRTQQERDKVEAELRDRYGPPPEAVENLMRYSLLKSRAEALRVAAIERRANRLTVRFREDSKVDPQRLMSFVSSTPGVTFSPGGELEWVGVPLHAGELLGSVGDLLTRLTA